MPSPAKMVATPQKGKTVTKKTEMLERRSEKVQTIDNAIIFDGYEGSEPTATDHSGANQPEVIFGVFFLLDSLNASSCLFF